ncbi:aminodeoxychorismate lyase [Propionibacteriaceae bacterium G1746]|uniref:aminodeoxychorismate lyase n=1 Tax=Aestuariimicrobium sp. G57 TaxID=3418485 RepID=UPI003C1E94C1
MSAQQLVGVIGRGVFPAGQLVISADDLGFTRGDGCFDATRVVTDAEGNSLVENLDAHFDRFDASIVGVGGEPIDRDAWRATIDEALDAWTEPGEAVLKIMYSNGQESQRFGAGADRPTEVFTLTQMPVSNISDRAGISVAMLSRGMPSNAFADAPWLLGGVKSLAYAVNVAAKREAHARGAQDVLFTSTDGYALEGPTSALICLIDGVLVTTPIEGTGILHSITQRMVFEGAEAAGFETATRLMTTDEVRGAEGAWFASSVRGLVPLVAVDGTPLPQHADLTHRLRQWARFVD